MHKITFCWLTRKTNMAPGPWLQVKDVAIRNKHLKLQGQDLAELLRHYNAVRVAYTGKLSAEKPPIPAELRVQIE